MFRDMIALLDSLTLQQALVPCPDIRELRQVGLMPVVARHPRPTSHVGNGIRVADEVAPLKTAVKDTIKPVDFGLECSSAKGALPGLKCR